MKIKVVNEQWNDQLAVLFYDDSEKNGPYRVVKPLQLVIEELEESEIIEPTFRLPRQEMYDFLQSMADMAEKMGIKTTKQLTQEQKYEGKLEATEYHLEDMRKLVFKNK